MNYKGYIAKVDFDENAETFYGIVINSNALISFRGKDVNELVTSFKNSVETYLDTCKNEGIEPEKSYSGKFNIRISPEIHQKLAIKAALSHESMNEHIEKLLFQDVENIEMELTVN